MILSQNKTERNEFCEACHSAVHSPLVSKQQGKPTSFVSRLSKLLAVYII